MKNLLFCFIILFFSQISYSQTEISGEKFEELFTNTTDGEIYMIEFYATWCGYCKQMAPIVKDYADRYAESITFYYIDIDKTTVDEKYGLEGAPYYLLIKDGEVLELIEGADVDAFKSMIETYSSENESSSSGSVFREHSELDSSEEETYDAKTSMSQLIELMELLEVDTYGDPEYIYLNDDEEKTFYITLSREKDFLISVIGDSDVEDVDLVVYDSKGNTIGEDTDSDATPVVEISSSGTGNEEFKVVLKMIKCGNAPCETGVVIFKND